MEDKNEKHGFFNIGRTESIDIPGLGTVDIGLITGADEIASLEASESVDEGGKAETHTSVLLSRLIKSPSLEPSKILMLSDEQIELIVNHVLEMNGAAPFATASESGQLQRLYCALLEQRRDSRDSMVKAMESMQKPILFSELDLEPFQFGSHTLPDAFMSSSMEAVRKFVDPLASHRTAVEALFRNHKQYEQLAKSLESVSTGFQTDLAAQVFNAFDQSKYFRENLESLSSQIAMSRTFIESWSGIADASAAFLSIRGLSKNLHSITSSSLLGSSTAWATELTMGSAVLNSISAPDHLADVVTHRGMIMAGYYSEQVHSQGYEEPVGVLVDNDDSLAEAAEQERTTRRRRCQDILDKFERRLRSHVEGRLEGQFGPRWWRQRVSGEIKDAAKRRQEVREIGTAERQHPIHYTSLGELKVIITQNNNWDGVFEQDFKVRTHLETMLEFVMTVRNDVDHGRHPNNDAYTRFGVGVDFVYEFIGYHDRVSPRED